MIEQYLAPLFLFLGCVSTAYRCLLFSLTRRFRVRVRLNLEIDAHNTTSPDGG